MFSASLPAAQLSGARFTFILVLLLAMPVISAQAQGGIDNDPAQAIGNQLSARNTIQGNVYLPSGNRLDRRVRVRINGVTGGDLNTFTDEEGAFIFRRLAAGTYFITIDAGKEFERVSETVDIFGRSGRQERGQTIMVHIQLQLKNSKEQKPATVSAALAAIPKPAQELYQKALESARTGNSKEAITHLKSALELHPEFMLALNELGVQHLRLNEFDKAAEALRSALKLAPEDFTPRLNYGLVLLKSKQFAEAEEQLRLALEKRPNAAVAHLYRGRALVYLARYADAEKELQTAIEQGGNEVNEAHRLLGAVYNEMGQPARAIAALEKYLSLEPQAKDAAAIRELIKQLRAQSASTQK